MRTPMRAMAMLAAAAAAGALIWFAGRFEHQTRHDYWISLGLLAGAGLVLGIARRGRRLRAGGVVIALAALLVGGWVALALQPGAGGDVSRWSREIGVAGVVNDLGVNVGVLGLAVGVVVGSSVGFVGRRRRAPEAAVAPTAAVEEHSSEPSVHAAPLRDGLGADSGARFGRGLAAGREGRREPRPRGRGGSCSRAVEKLWFGSRWKTS